LAHEPHRRVRPDLGVGGRQEGRGGARRHGAADATGGAARVTRPLFGGITTTGSGGIPTC
jgi:hypothetical protein